MTNKSLNTLTKKELMKLCKEKQRLIDKLRVQNRRLERTRSDLWRLVRYKVKGSVKIGRPKKQPQQIDLFK